MSAFDWAMIYLDRGWSIIPLKPMSKKPAIREWESFQHSRPTKEMIRGWFFGKPDRGIAVIAGPVSGGLVIRDFDSQAAYQAWAAEFPELARTLPTVITARGWHVYCRGELKLIQAASKSKEGSILDLGDGELRGGGYCVLPPTLHQDGKVSYSWVISLSEELPFLDLRETGFFQVWGVRDIATATESTERHRGHLKNTKTTEAIGGERGMSHESITKHGSTTVKVSPGTSANKNISPQRSKPPPATNGPPVPKKEPGTTTAGQEPMLSPELRKDISRVIQETLPKAIGQRNKLVFELCRGLKSIPALADTPHDELAMFKPIVREWHRLALPFISTKPFEETWIDFLRGWPRVKFAKGTEPMSAILKAAVEREVPACAADYEQPQLQLLVKVCRELQRVTGDGPFFLSSRTAGSLLEVDHSTAWRWLYLLKCDGVLTEVEKGDVVRRRATRFRYVASS